MWNSFCVAGFYTKVCLGGGCGIYKGPLRLLLVVPGTHYLYNEVPVMYCSSKTTMV